MLTEVKNNLKFIALSMKYNLKACMEYKKSFLVQTIFMIINNGFFLIFWNIVFGINGGSIQDLKMDNILYMWSLATTSWGLGNFLFGGIAELHRYITDCTLDTYLLQPKNMILNIAMSKNDYGSFGDFMYGLMLGIYVSDNIFSFLELMLFVALGTIITMSALLIIRLLAVIFGDVEKIVHIYEHTLFITLGIYPIEIFSGFIRGLMFTVIPVAYVVFLPESILLKFSIIKFIAVVIATAVCAFLAKILFYKAISKYESGNNIAMKE